jgi:hypothetical protein
MAEFSGVRGATLHRGETVIQLEKVKEDFTGEVLSKLKNKDYSIRQRSKQLRDRAF